MTHFSTTQLCGRLKSTEALILTSQANIFYYSGINTTGGEFLLMGKSKRFVISDARYIAEAARIARGYTPIGFDKKDKSWWRTLLKKNKIKTLFFESDDLSHSKLKRFKKLSRGAALLKPTTINLQELRAAKRADEIQKTTKALRITEKILETLCHIIRSGKRVSEYDLALEVRKRALNYGCDQLAFPPIIAFGRNCGVPHHHPSRARKLATGDMVLIDMGVKYKNYCADLTRTFFTKTPTTREADVYHKVLSAQKAAIEKIKPRASAAAVYDTAYKQLGEDASHFTHGLGHGVGLEIHESPNLKAESTERLRPGAVITVEPGLYFTWGGVRIEDMVLIEKEKTVNLTRAPKKLQILKT